MAMTETPRSAHRLHGFKDDSYIEA